MNAADVPNAKTSELVEYYNAHTTKTPVQKFADRRTAENRVLELIRSKPSDEDQREKAADEAMALVAARKAQEKASKPPKEPHLPADPEVTRMKLAEAAARTWTNPEVHAKRAQRSSVVVDGEPYTSVHAAFEALELPMSKHIKFRAKLKAEEELEEFGHKWEVVPLNY